MSEPTQPVTTVNDIRDLQQRVAQLEADFKTIWDQLIVIIGRLPAKAIFEPVPEHNSTLATTALRALPTWGVEEEEPEAYDMGPPAPPPNLGEVSFDAVVEAMVEWFFDNFEDPAHRTPWESAEGGYQYIWGGPHDAREELEDAFGTELEKQFGENMYTRALDAALERIGQDGCEWAPSESRMRPETHAARPIMPPRPPVLP